MSEEKEKGKMNLKHFLALHLGVSLLALLSVIPINLNMRSYGLMYVLVPFSSSLLCCFLAVLLPFPFLDFSIKKINQSPLRYKYLTKRSYFHIFFIIIIPISVILLMILMIFSLQDLDIIPEPFILSSISLPISYITALSTLIVLEQISQHNNQELEPKQKFGKKFFWVVFSFIFVSALAQLLNLFSFIVYGVLAGIFLIIFITVMIVLIVFLRKEDEKETEDVPTISRPFSTLILPLIFTLVTTLFCTLQILYTVFLEKGYLIINFDEFYSGFFLAIQGSYVLFLIIFYTVIYLIMNKKQMFE